jgi:PIN domain nuclease of toxin-antitoxin system
MKLLLDTHIWLWSSFQPARLSRRVAAALADAANELWLSPVSTWELVLLVGKGRIRLDVEIETWIRQAVAEPLREAPLTHEIALRTRALRLPHGDPADAWLAATAAVFDLTLVTADPRLMRSQGFAVLPNR